MDENITTLLAVKAWLATMMCGFVKVMHRQQVAAENSITGKYLFASNTNNNIYI